MRRGSAASEIPRGRLDRPPSMPPSRPGSRQGSKALQTPSGSRAGSKQRSSRQGSKESNDDDKYILPSGLWSATLQEGKGKTQKTRCEERHLEFQGGTVVGSTSFEGVLEGFVQRPNVEWTETYPWGSIVVRLRYHRLEPWLLDGHFEASDGGTGAITLVHPQLKEAVCMAT